MCTNIPQQEEEERNSGHDVTDAYIRSQQLWCLHKVTHNKNSQISILSGEGALEAPSLPEKLYQWLNSNGRRVTFLWYYDCW